MKVGDLVKTIKADAKVGVVVEIFSDLDKADPWVRVHWTTPYHSYEWCKIHGLEIVSESISEKK